MLEIHEDIKDLLRQNIADCDISGRRLILRRLEDHDLRLGRTVRKCGASSGNTYGKVISTDVNFRNPPDGFASEAAFSVGSKPNNQPFAQAGDSGSLVFEKEEVAPNVIQYKAHGLVWCRFSGINDSDGRLDPLATACADLNTNLETLRGDPYEDLGFPPPNPTGNLHEFKASIESDPAIND